MLGCLGAVVLVKAIAAKKAADGPTQDPPSNISRSKGGIHLGCLFFFDRSGDPRVLPFLGIPRSSTQSK